MRSNSDATVVEALGGTTIRKTENLFAASTDKFKAVALSDIGSM